MLKILYAANESDNAKIQLARFLQAIKDKDYTIKISTFKRSKPNNVNVDWTLDCLKNIFTPDIVTLDNENFHTYYQQVKYYKPDLIISDMEYFTSHIASALGTTLWQCSSSLINYALTPDYKYNLGIFKKYAYIFNKSHTLTQRVINTIDNSNCNFVYSHLGDVESPPPLKEDFEWIRPYHHVGKRSVVCQHNIVSASLGNNKKLLSLLKRYSDSVCFTEFSDEYYDDLSLKDISDWKEFGCNVKNANLFVTQGQTSFLADAFYNGKFSAVFPNFEDAECIVNSTISEKIGLSKTIYSSQEDLTPFLGLETPVSINSDIKFLHERIEDI